MKRRTFLRTAGAAGAAAAGVFSILKYPRGARAAGWGAWPSDRLDLRVPDDRIATSVLEIQLNGGMSPWDTFYTVPDWNADLRYVHQFTQAAGVFAGEATMEERFAICGYAGLEPWVPYPTGITDGAGVPLFMGPWSVPWRTRMDILSRMRIVVQRHDNVAHEGANPLCFTGDRLGQPRLAGLGTAVQRYFSENPEAGGGARTTPYSYVLFPGAGYAQANTLSASAVGFHPGSSRPLGVPVAANSPLSGLLARTGPGDAASFDAGVNYYRQRYETRFRTGELGSATRSAERENYEFANFARRHAPDLQAILHEDQFQRIVPPAPLCGGGNTATDDMPRMQARLAANLLTRTDGRARHVLWIDTGINPHPTGGHDNHTFHTQFASQNVTHTLTALAEIIGDRPDQINLATTMVIVNTEFGRTPHRQQQAAQTGTNHWPWGYITMFIGGPVTTPGCYGNIGYVPGFGIEESSDGHAVEYVTPAENRMMAMQAMGIYPFSSQSFAVGDVRGGVADEEQAATRILRDYLGVSS